MKCVICKKEIMRYQELVTRGDRSIYHIKCFIKKFGDSDLIKENEELRKSLEQETKNRKFWNKEYIELREGRKGIENLAKDNSGILKETIDKMDM